MQLNNIGDVIAVREIRLTDSSGSESVLEVSIGKPQPFGDSEGYYCPFRISGIEPERLKYAGGQDAVQSLQLAMVMIGAVLNSIREQLGGDLRWLGGAKGDSGFPNG